jgi:hypothetical protein
MGAVQEVEDRRRIQHLLALTQPVTQEVTYFRERRPDVLSRPHSASASGVGAATTTSTSAASVAAAVAEGKEYQSKPWAAAAQNVQERRGRSASIVLSLSYTPFLSHNNQSMGLCDVM